MKELLKKYDHTKLETEIMVEISVENFAKKYEYTLYLEMSLKTGDFSLLKKISCCYLKKSKYLRQFF